MAKPVLKLDLINKRAVDMASICIPIKELECYDPKTGETIKINYEENMIDLSKEYRTRDGRPVKLAGINRDAIESQQVIGWVDGCGGYYWSIEGKFISPTVDDPCDLIEVQKPQPGEVWESKAGDCFTRCFIVKKLSGAIIVVWEDGTNDKIHQYDTTQWTKVYPND